MSTQAFIHRSFVLRRLVPLPSPCVFVEKQTITKVGYGRIMGGWLEGVGLYAVLLKNLGEN